MKKGEIKNETTLQKPCMNWRGELLSHIIAQRKQKYLPGMRVECEAMFDNYRAVPPGTLGTIKYVDDVGTVFVNWDNGQQLGLVIEDYFRVVN